MSLLGDFQTWFFGTNPELVPARVASSPCASAGHVNGGHGSGARAATGFGITCPTCALPIDDPLRVTCPRCATELARASGCSGCHGC